MTRTRENKVAKKGKKPNSLTNSFVIYDMIILTETAQL